MTWLDYDRHFCHMATGSPGIVKTKVDPTLWNMAFTGQVKPLRAIASALSTSWRNVTAYCSTATGGKDITLNKPFQVILPHFLARLTKETVQNH